jgi:hypothetical protein
MDNNHEDNHTAYQTVHEDHKLLGALPKKPDARNLIATQFMDTSKSPPRTFDAELKHGIGPALRYKKSFEPFRGQGYGSCTISSQAEWLRRKERAVKFGKDLYIPDDVVNKRYFRLAGDPNWQSGNYNVQQYDNGLYELDAINDLLKVGFIHGGWTYKIDGFAEVPLQLELMKMAIATFGGIKVCIDVPMNFYHSGPDDQVDYDGSSIVGGHSMYWNAYDESTFMCVHTWTRKRQHVTNKFVEHCATESYSLIDAKDVKVQEFFDLKKFKQAQQEVMAQPYAG